MLQRLFETLGDKFFLLREKIDRTLHRSPTPKAKAEVKKREPFTWKRLRDPKEIRNLMNEYNLVVSLVALLLTIGACAFLFRSVFPSSGPQNLPVYYYDLSNGELFSGPSNQLPPIETPSKGTIGGQPAGVRAHVLSCGECSNPKDRYIAYLESFTPEGKKAMLEPVIPTDPSKGPPMTPMEREVGHIFARPNQEGGWVSATTEEGMKIMTEARSPCPDPNRFPHECLPDSR